MSGRLLRVLVPDLRAGQTDLSGPEAHHLVNVLRVKPGARVEAFDGRGNVAEGVVAKADRQLVSVTLSAPRRSEAEAPLQVSVGVALLKGDKLSDVVRQCTELGVARFHLLVTHHADAATISPARLLRLRRVAEEAARQSGRALVPAVHDPVRLSELSWSDQAIVAHPEAEQSLHEAWLRGESGAHTAVTLLTGPEGGFSAAEVAELAGRGARSVRFGPRILRAETAPVALAAALLLPGGR